MNENPEAPKAEDPAVPGTGPEECPRAEPPPVPAPSIYGHQWPPAGAQPHPTSAPVPAHVTGPPLAGPPVAGPPLAGPPFGGPPTGGAPTGPPPAHTPWPQPHYGPPPQPFGDPGHRFGEPPSHGQGQWGPPSWPPPGTAGQWPGMSGHEAPQAQKSDARDGGRHVPGRDGAPRCARRARGLDELHRVEWRAEHVVAIPLWL